jgi:hypothetical protein
MKFFEHMPTEAKAATFDQVSLDDRVTSLEKSPIWKSEYAMKFFEHMPTEAKAATFDQVSLDDRASSLEKSPIWKSEYAMPFFEHMPTEMKAATFDQVSLSDRADAFGRKPIEEKLAKLSRNPSWEEPLGQSFFARIPKIQTARLFDRMATHDQAVLYERMTTAVPAKKPFVD